MKTKSIILLSAAVSPFAGACKLVSGTARIIHGSLERTNKRIELAGERHTMMHRVRDQMERDNFDMEIMEHLVDFGLREKSAKERASELDEDVRDRLKERQEQYGVLLGKDPFDVSPADPAAA